MASLVGKIKSIISPELPLVSNLANASAVLETIGCVNWCGFYLSRGNCLFVGPFQGEVACAAIPFGRGVCGSAAEAKKTIVVDDVRTFPGHIACSELSRSEIVVPIIRRKTGEVFGVIDIDSPKEARFSEGELKSELEEIASILAPLFE